MIAHRSISGFTLLELVSVIMVMTVVLGLAVPRIMSGRDRESGLIVDRIASMMSTAAQRDTIGGRHISMRFDPDDRAMELYVREIGRNSTWKLDPLTPRILLGRLEFTDVQLDYGALSAPNGREWWIEFPRSEPRPSITITLSNGGSSGDTWVIRMSPSATSAVVQEPGEPVPPMLDAIDLDRSGMEDVPW